MRVEDHFLDFLVEGKGFSALYVDDALTITRVHSASSEIYAVLEKFCRRSLFDLFPELKSEFPTLTQKLETSGRFMCTSQRFSRLHSLHTFDVLALYREDASHSETILVLFSSDSTTTLHLMQQLAAERKAKQKARKASIQARQASTQFLANISHEIRTPLNGVIGMTDLLLATPQSQEQREFTKIIRNSGEALLAVINDILDYAKIESGHIAYETEPFSLHTCIEECLDIHAARAAQKDIELIYSCAETCPDTIISDKNKFMQILNNLVSNAVKFTNQGEIIVSVTCYRQTATQSKISVQVKDSGIGIPGYAQKQIFAAFTQLESSQQGRQGGTGLGLAIAKKLVHTLGGSLAVKSRLGQGSTFSFDLCIPEAEQNQSNNEQDASLRHKRILFVDDNATSRQMVRHQLAKWGMVVVEAESAERTLHILEKDPHFDCAILDMNMPGNNGIQLAEKIRQHPSLNQLPLILLTSVHNPQKDAKLIKLDIRHHVTKPLKWSQLKHALLMSFSANSVDALPRSHSGALDSTLAQRHPRQILVAEDNRVNQQYIQKLLEKLGYSPTIVSDGREALSALESAKFDIVLMDIQMPNMDGMETARKIGERSAPEQRPQIIALTAHAMPGDREKYLNAGMTGYLSKPLKINELVQALTKSPNTPHKTPHMMPVRDNTINVDYIRKTMGLENGYDDDVIIDLLETYLGETTELWQKIKEGLADNNFDAIYRAAHTIKSSSDIIGAHRLADMASDITVPARHSDAASVRQLVHDMQSEKKAVFAQTHALIRDLKN